MDKSHANPLLDIATHPTFLLVILILVYAGLDHFRALWRHWQGQQRVKENEVLIAQVRTEIEEAKGKGV